MKETTKMLFAHKFFTELKIEGVTPEEVVEVTEKMKVLAYTAKLENEKYIKKSKGNLRGKRS